MSAAPQSSDLSITQRTIPAGSAPPVFSRAPSSVFALGAKALGEGAAGRVEDVSPRPAQPAGGAARADAPRTEKAIALLRERGPMTSIEVAAALACDTQNARSMLCALKDRGVGVVGKSGRSQVYGLADAPTTLNTSPASVPDAGAESGSAKAPALGGFKKWLEGQGEAQAQPQSGRRRRNATSTKRQAPLATAAGVPPTPAIPLKVKAAEAVPELLCGLFNNGDLVLELGEQRLRLNKAQTRQLVDYLDLVGSATLQADQS